MRWRTPVVILVCGGIILGLALGTRQSFGLFLRPMSMDLGWGREAFSFAIALQNLVWGCAMPFAGAIADRYGAGRYSKRLLLAWIYAIRAVAIAVFIAAPLTLGGTYLFAAVLGLTWLGTVPLTNSLVGQIFGVKYLSTLFSIAFLGHQLGAFIGAWAGGAVFDLTGSYQLVWFTAVALSVLAAALCVPIN